MARNKTVPNFPLLASNQGTILGLPTLLIIVATQMLAIPTFLTTCEFHMQPYPSASMVCSLWYSRLFRHNFTSSTEVSLDKVAPHTQMNVIADGATACFHTRMRVHASCAQTRDDVPRP